MEVWAGAVRGYRTAMAESAAAAAAATSPSVMADSVVASAAAAAAEVRGSAGQFSLIRDRYRWPTPPFRMTKLQAAQPIPMEVAHTVRAKAALCSSIPAQRPQVQTSHSQETAQPKPASIPPVDTTTTEIGTTAPVPSCNAPVSTT